MFTRASRSRLGSSLGMFLLALGTGWACAAFAHSAEADVSVESQAPRAQFLEDPVEPFAPATPRTEAEQDHLAALAQFSAARMHERQREYPEALRLYQRALRNDPEALPAAEAIVALTLRLNREQEALAYIVKMIELEESPDAAQLEEVGTFLFQSGDLDGAIRLYEKALDVVARAEKPTADATRLRLALGRFHVAVEHFDKGADYFAQAIEAFEQPDDHGLDARSRARLLADPGRVYSLIGETFLLANRLDEAAAAFEKAHELDPDESFVAFNRARIFAERKDFAQALDALDACLENPPDDLAMAPYDLLGEVLDALDRGDEVVERLDRLADAHSDNLPLKLTLAERLEKTPRTDQAESIYRAMADKTPLDLAFRGLARIHRQNKNPEAMLDLLDEVLRKTQAIETLGSEISDIAADEPMMKRVFETARERYKADPKKFGYHARYGVALLALEAMRTDEAAEFFELALEADPKRAPDVLLIWGIGLLLEEHAADAAEVFRRAIAHPAMVDQLANLHFLLSGALIADEQTDEALAAARKAVELQPESSAMHSRVAWILYRARRYDEADAAYRAVIEKFGDDYTSLDTRADLREARLILSNLCVIKDDMEGAEEWLQQVLDEYPDDPGASNDLGYLWADQGKHLERSLKMIQLAVDAEPDNAAYLDSLGWVLYRLERYDDAVAQLKKAVATQDEPDPVILDHLGDALEKVGQADDARRAWSQAVEAYQNADETDKAKAIQEKIKQPT